MHKRKEIRDSIVERLKGATHCGERVFSNRGRSFFASELPSITVYTDSESSQFLNAPENRLRRTIKLIIEAATIQQCHIDDELDELAMQIEAAIPNSQLFDGLIQNISLSQSEMGLADKGEKVMGSVRMTYEVEYDT